jgi:hypothetical protein
MGVLLLPIPAGTDAAQVLAAAGARVLKLSMAVRKSPYMAKSRWLWPDFRALARIP